MTGIIAGMIALLFLLSLICMLFALQVVNYSETVVKCLHLHTCVYTPRDESAASPHKNTAEVFILKLLIF